MLEAIVLSIGTLLATAMLMTAATVAGVRRNGRCREMNDSEFAALVDEEGGILEAIDRGVTADDLQDGDVKDAWNRVDYAFDELQSAITELEDLLAGAGEDE